MRIAVVLQLLLLAAVSRSARLAGGVQIRRLASGDPSDEQLAESVRRLLSAEVDLQPSGDWWERHCMFVLLDLFVETSFVSATRTFGAVPEVHFIDYCVGAGIVFTLWLALIYWKVRVCAWQTILLHVHSRPHT